jgi:hypothetical protein
MNRQMSLEILCIVPLPSPADTDLQSLEIRPSPRYGIWCRKWRERRELAAMRGQRHDPRISVERLRRFRFPLNNRYRAPEVVLRE